ncbi:MAG TPA: dihydroorotase family protein [Vicinamibacterales bacterium]|nr:dihydroorotase family protein [Vicinamibacterales bacterium]
MAVVDLLLTGGEILTPGGRISGTIGVKDGRIAFISSNSWTPSAARVVDAAGRVVVPGFIDTHVHFRDPGLTYKEDFTTGSMAAAAGGVTCVVDMPNNKPGINTTERFRNKLSTIKDKSVVDYGLYAGATNLGEIPGMLEAGAVGVKIFMVRDPKSNYPHDPELFTGDDGVMYDTIKLVGEEGFYCAVHPTNQQIFEHESRKRWAAGTMGPRDFMEAYFGENFVSDHTAIATLVQMADASRARVHILHLRSEGGIKHIQRAKEDGVPVTLEVNPKYMLHTIEEMERLGPRCTPYGMSRDKQDALFACVRNGWADVFATDHAPHTRDEMEPGWKDAWSIPFGNPQLDHYVPALLTRVSEGAMSLEMLVRVCAEAPAKLLGIYPRKGVIQADADADLTVLDLDHEGVLTDDEVYTKVGWSPYAGRRYKGRPVMTIVRGQVVMENGKVIGTPGWGRLVPGVRRQTTTSA